MMKFWQSSGKKSKKLAKGVALAETEQHDSCPKCGAFNPQKTFVKAKHTYHMSCPAITRPAYMDCICEKCLYRWAEPYTIEERDYGRAIRILRAARGMTQRKLARKAQLDPSYISQIEAGKRVMGRSALYKISKALDCGDLHIISFASPFEEIDPDYYRSLLAVLVGCKNQ